MTNILLIVQTVAAVIPLLHQLCQVVEQQFPGAKRGAEKLDAALSMFSSIAPTLGPVLGPIAAALPSGALKTIISALVGGMNKANGAGGAAPVAPIVAPPGT